jgi:poly(ADP-ribose) glycohydrolase ARH3
LAIEGAILVAHTTVAVMNGTPTLEVLNSVESRITGDEFKSRITTAKNWLASGRSPVKQELIRYLGNGIAAQKSCVTAAYVALHFRDQPFLSMQQFINRCGGDADTIGSIAGAIWGVANGSSKLPHSILCKLEQRNRLEKLARQLYERISAQPQHS